MVRKMEEMNSIDAQETDIGEYLREMVWRTEKDNSVTGKINNAVHGNIRVVMFIEDNVSKPYGAD